MPRLRALRQHSRRSCPRASIQDGQLHADVLAPRRFVSIRSKRWIRASEQSCVIFGLKGVRRALAWKIACLSGRVIRFITLTFGFVPSVLHEFCRRLRAAPSSFHSLQSARDLFREPVGAQALSFAAANCAQSCASVMSSSPGERVGERTRGEREVDLAPGHALVPFAVHVLAGVRRWQTSRVAHTALALGDRCAGETLGFDGRADIDRLTRAPLARIGHSRWQHHLAARRHGILRITGELAARGAPIVVVGISVVALLPWLPRTVSTFLAGRCRGRVATGWPIHTGGCPGSPHAPAWHELLSQKFPHCAPSGRSSTLH